MKEKVGVRTKQIEDSTNNQLHKIRHQAIDLYCLDIHIKEFEKKKLQQQKEVIWPSNNLLGRMNSMWSSHLISLLRGKNHPTRSWQVRRHVNCKWDHPLNVMAKEIENKNHLSSHLSASGCRVPTHQQADVVCWSLFTFTDLGDVVILTQVLRDLHSKEN